MALVYIGLGSNLGDRLINIKNACKELLQNSNIILVKSGSIEETDPVDYLDQQPFLNQIILVETNILPDNLLTELKSIEIRLGREKTILKGPRIIDLDILLYDNTIQNTSELTIPHPEIKNRLFILKHLVEIDPDLIDPASGVLYRDIYKNKVSQI